MRSPKPTEVALGLLGGLLASFVVIRVEKRLAAIATEDAPAPEPPTEKLAERLAIVATGRSPPADVRSIAGTAVHYGFGAGLGVVYVGAAATWPVARAGFGTLYGAAVAVVFSGTILPALGLLPPARHIPVRVHARTLAAHLAFGAVLEASLRARLRMATGD